MEKGKGRIAMLILSKLKEKDANKSDSGSSQESESPGSDVDAGLESIADELISCVKRGDSSGAAKALCDFIDAHESSCMNDGSEEKDDEDY